MSRSSVIVAALAASAFYAAFSANPSSAQANKAADCEKAKSTIAALRKTLDEPGGVTQQLSDKYRELNLLDAMSARTGTQTLTPAQLVQLVGALSRGELVPPDLTRWARGVTGSVGPSEIAAQRAEVRTKIDDLEKKKSDADKAISEQRQKQFDLGCDLNAGNEGGIVSQPSVGTTTSTTSVDPTATTTPTIVKGTRDDWSNDWTHDFGTITFAWNGDLTLVNGLDSADAYGPAITCDGTAAFLGTVEWKTAGGGFTSRWTGSKVVACTNGDYLEGKISDYNSGTRTPHSASFKIGFADSAKKTFIGTYRIRSQGTDGPEMNWSGKRD